MSRRNLLIFGLVAIAYGLGAQVAYLWFGAGVFPVFFPAAGVTLSALVLTPRRSWPVVLAGAATAEVVVDLAHDSDVAAALGFAVANLTEAVLGATLLLVATRGHKVDLSRRGDLLAFLALPVVCSPAVGGMLGAANADLLGGGAEWPQFAVRWWVGDGLGVLVVGGAVIAVARSGLGRVRERWAEALASACAATAGTVLAFVLDDVQWAYVPFVLMPWIALRMGTSAVAVVGALVATVAAQEVSLAPTLWNQIDAAPRSAVIHVQVAIALTTAMSLLLAAEARERDRAVRARVRADEQHRYEHDVAVSLQRALLPERLVDDPLVALAATYRPSDARLEVGGDWYETVALPDGRVVIAVGDVVGHGLDAAVAMGQLRTALRALAPDCASPVALLAQLDDFADGPAMRYSTACIATLDPVTGVLRHASAGHPPLLVVDPRGACSFLHDGRSWPLRSTEGARGADGTTTLAPGSTLVLYSDGLIERRGEVIDRGLDRLVRAAERHHRLEPSALCDALAVELLDGHHAEDDVVVVAARLTAAPQPAPSPAADEPAALRTGAPVA